MENIRDRILGCVKKGVPVGLKTSYWFLKIMLPVSFFVMLLSYFNILPYLSSFAAPLFTALGLPGDAALVFVSSIFTNIYTVIALIATLDFTVREGVILAVMCLISHGFIIETLVQKKTGSSAWRMMGLRVICSFIAAFLLNRVMPEMPARLTPAATVSMGFQETLLHWLESSLWLCGKIFVIIISLMIVQRMLEEFGILKWLSGCFSPLMRIFGLPASVSFLWILGNTVGLAYGSAIMMDYARSGKLDRREADLINHHLAVSHSQVEDPLLFMVIGLPVLWLMIPRFLLAIFAVWERRLEYKFQDRKQKNKERKALLEHELLEEETVSLRHS